MKARTYTQSGRGGNEHQCREPPPPPANAQNPGAQSLEYHTVQSGDPAVPYPNHYAWGEDRRSS